MMGETYSIEETAERFEMSLVIANASLSLNRNMNQQRRRESRFSQRRHQSPPSVPQRDERDSIRSVSDLRLIKHLVSQELSSGERVDLCVGEIGEGLKAGHSSDQLAKEDEIFVVSRNELVDEILEEDGEGGFHRRPSSEKLSSEHGESCGQVFVNIDSCECDKKLTLKPSGNASPIVLRLALPSSQRVQERIRQDIIPKLGQISRRLDNRTDQIIVALHLLQRNGEDDRRIRMRDLAERLSELFDVLGR